MNIDKELERVEEEAHSAHSAAWSAAYSAVWSAVYSAAWSATHSAGSTARSAAWSAAHSANSSTVKLEEQLKQVEMIKELL